MRAVVLAAVAYAATMRLAELALSRRNERRLLARGGRRVRPDGMTGLVAVHVGWILGMAAEEALLGPTFHTTAPRATAAVAFVLAELLRLACIATLGERWSVRVVVLDGEPPVHRGPYRWLEHPNYLGVVAGLVALPLALGLAVVPALVLPAKLAVLRRRIAVEERALGR